jgi:ferredoxin-NADP reductase
MIRTLLAEKSTSSITLLYSNRSEESTIFGSELAQLEKSHSNLKIKHFISGKNRIAEDDIGEIAKNNNQIQAYICGPESLKIAAKSYLETAEVSENSVHTEDFVDGYVRLFGLIK